MQSPAQLINGSLQTRIGPQPVDVTAGLLIVIARQNAQLIEMLRPVADLANLLLQEKVDALDARLVRET